MAEYSDVIKQFKRMCWYYSRDKMQKSCPMCTSYPNCNIGQCRKIAFEKPAHFAATVMRWAAEHPEPVYPRWVDWLVQVGVVGCETSHGNNHYFVEDDMFEHIPEETAQLLGLKPLPIVNGDGGATNEADARKNLGL